MHIALQYISALDFSLPAAVRKSFWEQAVQSRTAPPAPNVRGQVMGTGTKAPAPNVRGQVMGTGTKAPALNARGRVTGTETAPPASNVRGRVMGTGMGLKRLLSMKKVSYSIWDDNACS